MKLTVLCSTWALSYSLPFSYLFFFSSYLYPSLSSSHSSSLVQVNVLILPLSILLLSFFILSAGEYTHPSSIHPSTPYSSLVQVNILSFLYPSFYSFFILSSGEYTHPTSPSFYSFFILSSGDYTHSTSIHPSTHSSSLVMVYILNTHPFSINPSTHSSSLVIYICCL